MCIQLLCIENCAKWLCGSAINFSFSPCCCCWRESNEWWGINCWKKRHSATKASRCTNSSTHSHFVSFYSFFSKRIKIIYQVQIYSLLSNPFLQSFFSLFIFFHCLNLFTSTSKSVARFMFCCFRRRYMYVTNEIGFCFAAERREKKRETKN